jgi:mRNA interferase MazF
VVTPAAGTVVLVPFPFSDLSQVKLRPAVVLAEVGRGIGFYAKLPAIPMEIPVQSCWRMRALPWGHSVW